MHRICNSLSDNGYSITLVGRILKDSKTLEQKAFRQTRIKCLFNNGFLFYAEYNIRLFFILLKQKPDAVCAIDLDTILPCLLISKIMSIPRIYDAHEFFTELKEVRTRPLVKSFWSFIEGVCVPQFEHGYTVSEGLVVQFATLYQRDYLVIRNMPPLLPLSESSSSEKYLFYGGAVNEARGFEKLIPAMKRIPCKLVIAGDGNFMKQLKKSIQLHGITDKIQLTGMISPEKLREYAERAAMGVSFTEKEGVHHYYALPNKFFDYMHACLPQVTMNLPEYKKINDEYEVAVLINDLNEETLVETINNAMSNDALLQRLRKNCMEARTIYHWGTDEEELLKFYQKILPVE
jgi:glycosyltransferase involved in cell wall biosynthesis